LNPRVKSWLKHPFRTTIKLAWLVAELSLAAIRYAVNCAFQPPALRRTARAEWLRRSSRRVLRVFGLVTRAEGELPDHGLLVCNHLSYLDVLVLASLSPCVFVAKLEVKRWPVFGWFAVLAGTVFVDRSRRTQAQPAADEIKSALDSGSLVVLFPEGTSSGGEAVLPFKSSLLEPAVRQTHPLAVGFLRYELDDGDVSEEVCYWKNMTFAPHLLNLLGKRGVRASVRFTRLREGVADRKALARQLHSEVLKLSEAMLVR
jgi:lyso-ornithine lipid O-acyltransferase